ncbi:hypothetical protein N836_00250 [Leptolyngbya sp. Heron Island J]|uniref:hypothetical protein n=1 Tax=Leptolyngbya sp. Heron Island J TaxID=1385935 RepID=UPI0003B9F254|nr:hypothetical protein [Leptolyngbya sp. Heron Island J]ESA37144.1 hypothetical protein N836_00250 [Leptolyngbya sp. Heron Island J]
MEADETSDDDEQFALQDVAEEIANFKAPRSLGEGERLTLSLEQKQAMCRNINAYQEACNRGMVGRDASLQILERSGLCNCVVGCGKQIRIEQCRCGLDFLFGYE